MWNGESKMESLETMEVGKNNGVSKANGIKVSFGPLCVDGKYDQFDMRFVDSAAASLKAITDEEFSERCRQVSFKVAALPVAQNVECSASILIN